MLSHSITSKIAITARRSYQEFAYHAYSIWLFTFSDIKTAILPSLLFAILTACARPDGLTIQSFQRIPVVLFWLWINLLPFTLGNQRQTQAVAEDALNKPWRPLPAKRMRPEHASMILYCTYPLALLTSLCVGGTQRCLTLMALGIWYNDFKGSDQHWTTRNFLSAGGLVSFSSGALEVLLGHASPPTQRMTHWYMIIGCVIFSMMHVSDMYDQEGDKLRGRRTVPLVIGDTTARWSIALAMCFWCLFCPWMWQVAALGYCLCVSLGALIAARCLLLRTTKADKFTYLLWNIWLVVLYSLPLLGPVAI